MFRIKHWTITLSLPYLVLGLMLVSLFVRLGYWQLSRAVEKQSMLVAQAQRGTLAPQSLPNELRGLDNYTPVVIQGRYEPRHTFIIQNRYLKHRLGVQIVTAFKVEKSGKSVLVDRGWLPSEQAKSAWLEEHTIRSLITLKGFVYNPGKPFKLNDKLDAPGQWPLLLPQYDEDVMRDHLSSASYPFIIVTFENMPGSFLNNFEAVSMSPERHRGYAIQWFAFAVVAATAFISLSIRNFGIDDLER